MAKPVIRVEYWRCLRDASAMVLYLMIEGHEDRPYKIEATLHRDGSPVERKLTTRGQLDQSPAHIEVIINTGGLAPGNYDVSVSFDGVEVGTFPCEVGDPATA